MYNWITLPYTLNYYNIVSQLYSNIKLKTKGKVMLLIQQDVQEDVSAGQRHGKVEDGVVCHL